MSDVRARRRAVGAALAALLTSIGLASASNATTPKAGIDPNAATISKQARDTSDLHPNLTALRADFYDARLGRVPDRPRALTSLEIRAASAGARPATQRLRASLGREAVVDMDGTTRTVHFVARLDGYLTGPSSRPARQIAMSYVRSHHRALGLTARDLRTFRFRQDYIDIDGIHHLSWTQTIDGTTVFGSGLQVAVTRTGRILVVEGSPVSGLGTPSVRVAPTARVDGASITTARAAIGASLRDAGEPDVTVAGDDASPVIFVVDHRAYRAWQVLTVASRTMMSVVDQTGHMLYRHDLDSDAFGDSPADTSAPWARGLARSADRRTTRRAGAAANPNTAVAPPAGQSIGNRFLFFPDARHGGRTSTINYTKRGWLSGHARILSGNNTHVYADTNDDNKANPNEEIHPKTPHAWTYTLKPFHLKRYSFCDNPWPCSWNPDKRYSWRTNRNQNAAQLFFFVNLWHDHLGVPPIGFDQAAGNFQRVNSTGKGKAGDPVIAQSDDGANTNNGLPDSFHIDNANMTTPPDGQSPRMQMYLQHQPHTSYPGGDPYSPTNVGDEADTVYHEYTHGLSNRLVVDPNGNSTLGYVQAGAMGEAWSDWYAMDYLVAHHLQRDEPDKVDVVIFRYDGAGVKFDRFEPMDCKIGSPASRCPGGHTGHTGGFTYGDYGHVYTSPEVHADGEIWSQTLWDLRDRLGSRLTEALVTRAMELSPANPSFLDERNAILLADLALDGGTHATTIWDVFARRGMGYFAGSLSGNDTTPGESFRVPPTDSSAGSIQGTVSDADTDRVLPDARVTIAFEGSPFVINPSVKTDSSGSFSIGPVPYGTYPKIVVTAKGHHTAVLSERVDAPAVTMNVQLRAD